VRARNAAVACAHAADRDAIGRRFASLSGMAFRLVPKMMRFANSKIRGQSTRPKYAVCRDWTIGPFSAGAIRLR
jgi:hypothetical protein